MLLPDVASDVFLLPWFLRFITRGAAGTFGGLLCAAATALFLAYWFSAKEEVQGLKEVFQT